MDPPEGRLIGALALREAAAVHAVVDVRVDPLVQAVDRAPQRLRVQVKTRLQQRISLSVVGKIRPNNFSDGAGQRLGHRYRPGGRPNSQVLIPQTNHYA